MYRIPIPDGIIVNKYYDSYSPLLYSVIKDFLDNGTILNVAMGSKQAYHFECGLTPGSDAYNWVKSLLEEEKLKQLLIGNWNSMGLIKDEIEHIQSNFRMSLTMKKYSIHNARHNVFVEDLNEILNVIFVKNLYENQLDKAEVVRMKGIRICPYCGAESLKNFRNAKGHFIKSQLDHYLPKSSYPFLAMNFFNLFPVCKDCNMVDTGKGEKSPVSDDLKTIYLPYPHFFDTTSFNFTCNYSGGAVYDEASYHIDIDFHGNDNLKKGYNEIIPIHPFYKEMTHVPVEIMTTMHEREQEYIELTAKMTNIEKSRFLPSLKSVCGFPENNDAACLHEKHKFKVDIYNDLVRYFASPLP